MLAGLRTHTEEDIVKLLSDQGRMDASDLRNLLVEGGLSCTLQGVYRVLRKLHNEGVVAKERHRYSLRISWVLELSSLVQKMEQTYLHETYFSELLPKEGDEHIWTFPHVFTLSTFRAQLLLAMVRQTGKKIALSYTPHLWNILLQKKQEEQFLSTFLAQVHYAYTIVSGKTYLDRYIHSVMQDAFSNHTYYLPEEGEYVDRYPHVALDVIDDYILKIRFDRGTYRRIDHLFKNTAPLSDINSLDVLPICTETGRMKITLCKNRIQAKYYRRKFEQLFGPLV